MEDMNKALEKLKILERLSAFNHEMQVARNRLTDAWPVVPMDEKVRRQKAYRIGEIIKGVDQLIQAVKYGNEAKLPADLEDYFRQLRASIP